MSLGERGHMFDSLHFSVYCADVDRIFEGLYNSELSSKNAYLPFQYRDNVNKSEKRNIWGGGQCWWVTASKINVENTNEIKAQQPRTLEYDQDPSITICGMWKVAGINTRGTGNLVSENTAGIFLNVKKKEKFTYKNHLEPQVVMNTEDSLHNIL